MPRFGLMTQHGTSAAAPCQERFANGLSACACGCIRPPWLLDQVVLSPLRPETRALRLPRANRLRSAVNARRRNSYPEARMYGPVSRVSRPPALPRCVSRGPRHVDKIGPGFDLRGAQEPNVDQFLQGISQELAELGKIFGG